MAFDPVLVAKEILHSYAMNLIGIHPQAMNRLLERLGNPDMPSDTKLGDLVRMKGPYLQALGIPLWSSSDWRSFAQNVRGLLAPTGLTPELVDTFEELKFKRLYRFQEEGLHSILEDKHTLIVAGTGRGKTESWMLPIFQYIISRKRNDIHDIIAANGTKALLIYPTKALAQDQLKRLINYLFRLNAKLEPAARISVGIFDGDTPHRGETTKQAYLREAFQYFRCPIYDSGAARCKTCGQHLSIVYDLVHQQRLNLAVPRAECRDAADLGFVRLVREDIVETCPDIVLTNPDMLNLRLLNVNGSDERRFLIEQPRFIVLDEVHTYTELFGSFTSWILRRLVQQRAEMRRQRRDVSADPLRFIAASATVANDVDLFVRLCNLSVQDVAVVREQTLDMPEPDGVEVPEFLHEISLTDDALDAALRALAGGQLPRQPYAEVFDLFDLQPADLPSLEGGEETVLDAAAERMFTVLSTDQEGSPRLNIMRWLYGVLTNSPLTPTELEDKVLKRFPAFDSCAADYLIGNFALLGARSGLLENRVHLFAWPIDGFYVCLRCGHVYDAPQGSCEVCGGHFITKLALCRECGEEAVESWFCPHCQKLYPLHATVEGEMVYWQGFACNCTGKELPTLRVIWKPWYKCTNCGIPHRKSTGDLSGREPAICEHCGQRVEPILKLPWVCRSCGLPYFSEDIPQDCTCGSHTFALGGLADISQAAHCEECKKDFLPGMPHDSAHTLTPTGAYQEFKVLSANWQIRKPSAFRTAVPCYHPRSRYDKRGRYELLMRSPANAAVTSAQFALRSVAAHGGNFTSGPSLQAVKMLSFSDSYNDMEQLAQDFDDPERNTFVDQTITDELLQGEMTLAALQNRLLERLRNYSQDHGQNTTGPSQSYDWVQHFVDTSVYDEVARRFVSGSYRGPGTQLPWLVREGIANIRLTNPPQSKSEAAILHSLAQRNNQRRSYLRDNLLGNVPDFDEVLEHLRECGLVEIDPKKRIEIVSLSSSQLVCYLVDASHPIRYSARHTRFISELERSFTVAESTDDYNMSLRYDERIDPQTPQFSYAAYRTAFTPPLLLRSEVYKGDVEKLARRRIEHEFKYGSDLHFLSSGPAMEVGIDIGDLNLLLLYGTPPNTNNYLQRIGRAGRRTKRSLVVSVSKRNPIDYFYYHHPVNLISSSAQPVPLNELNEEVLRVSLTWALLDYVAGNYWVPWKRERTPDATRYTDGQDFVPISAPPPADILRLLMIIFSVPAREIGYGQPLQALDTIIHDRRDDARTYLVQLLNQRVCNTCGAYLTAEDNGCPEDGCDGAPILLAQKHSRLIDEALDEFASRMVDFLISFRKELRAKRRSLNRKLESIEDALDEASSMTAEQRQDQMVQLETVERRLRAIENLMEQLDGATLAKAQAYSSQARYAYQIRSTEDVVEIIRHGTDLQGVSRSESRPSRGMAMAVKEYHPYAVVMSGREKTFTRAATFDDYRTTELRTRLESTPLAKQPLVCPRCGNAYDTTDSNSCACGADLVRMELQVLRRADTQPLKMPLAADPDTPGAQLYPVQVFRSGDTDKQVRRTYTSLSSDVISFVPLQQFEILDDSERPVGRLDFGDLETVTFVDGCTVIYEDSTREPGTQRFTLCGVEDCNGVIVQSRSTPCCALNPHHDVSKRRVVRLGYLFNTQGLRLQLYAEPWVITHSLAHGFRVALEKIGGLSVRNINELPDERQGIVHIYDATPGGAGVSELLVRMQNGSYRNFATALEVTQSLVSECECKDGCPHCLYQYGCGIWNRPSSLSRHGLWAFLLNGLQLRRLGGESNDVTMPEALSSVAYGPGELPVSTRQHEEEALRQLTWRLICNLERQLRDVIVERHQDKYGESWMDQVPETMRTAWENTRELDARAFKAYGSSGTTLLDYSYLGELLVLINSRWQLFSDTFGQGKEAKRELHQKLEAIIKVRNPLAHNRDVPENELKRTEVYCTDVLMKLNKAD